MRLEPIAYLVALEVACPVKGRQLVARLETGVGAQMKHPPPFPSPPLSQTNSQVRLEQIADLIALEVARPVKRRPLIAGFETGVGPQMKHDLHVL